MISPSRLSLNQATVKYASLREAVDACRRADIGAIGVWREAYTEQGAVAASRLLRDANLAVSSLCRGGFLTAPDNEARNIALADNKRALAEARELGTDTLILVVGGLPAGDRDLAGARRRVTEAIGELVPTAIDCGVRLAIEPLHPMFCADRAVVSTLSQALSIAEQFPAAAVGVVVDTYHVWWDPELSAQIRRARGRIASFQVCDWVVPLPADMLLGRGHLGDGHINFGAIAAMVEAADYEGYVEVEIFNQDVWSAPIDDTVERVVKTFRGYLG